MYIKIPIGLMFLILSGCSSISIHAPLAQTHKEVIELSYCVSSSSEMATIESDLSDEENKKEFNKNIKNAIDDINNKLLTGITHTSKLHIVAVAECFNDADILNISSDLYLPIELTGYGSIKEDWKNVLIGTGVAEGVIQGIVVGSVTGNPWLGLAVGAEEITSEYLVWNGVDWVLGETYAPVTLEGKMFYIKNNEIIWQDSSFVTENEDALSDDEKKDKSSQLKASLHKAEEELLASINNYLKNEILKTIQVH